MQRKSAGSQAGKVRPAAVAGRFYTADKRALRAEIAGLLARVPATAATVPKALIAPHAGYVYSGAVAAAAFATLRESAGVIERVVLIGPAHYVPVRGIAVPTAGAFATPLGDVPLDHDPMAPTATLACIVQADAPHAPEHALEVELPFLQAVLGRFTLVPLLVGSATAGEVADVLRAFWGGPETLIVVSSDLSHYHSYDTARRLDAATAAAIERGDWVSLGPNDACGFLPIAGLLAVATARGLGGRRLALANSGDTAGSRDRVVGYGAWMFAE
jgi:MEMO1 family protein